MKSCKRWAAASRRRRDLCDGRVQGGVAFGKKAKPSTPMDKLMHNDYMTGNTLLCYPLLPFSFKFLASEARAVKAAVFSRSFSAVAA